MEMFITDDFIAKILFLSIKVYPILNLKIFFYLQKLIFMSKRKNSDDYVRIMTHKCIRLYPFFFHLIKNRIISSEK